MRRFLASTLLCLPLAVSGAPRPVEVPAKVVRPVPTLPRAAKVDGELKDLERGLALAVKAGPGAAGNEGLQAKVAFYRDTLFLGVEVTDDALVSGDLLTVLLQFRNAGITSRGFAYRFAFDGKRSPEEGSGAPPFADALVQTSVQRRPTGWALEAAFPVRSLPRFPAQGPLLLDLCLRYEDRDTVAAEPRRISNCDGAGAEVPLVIPEELRKRLQLKPPRDVEGLEARADGWVGFAALHYPTWALANGSMTPQTLATMVSDAPVDPAQVDIPLPPKLALADGRPLFAVLSGKDPYAVAEQCDADRELRLGLYVVQGKSAERVLEWPAATCALGRALSFVLDDDGQLSIGYSNGTTTRFAWSTDHFERTEFGRR